VPVVTGALQNLPAGIGFTALLAAVVVGRGPATAWIHARPLALVGLVSYGVYLWHVPLMLFGIRLGLLPHAFVPRLIAVLVPAVLAGTASWLLVERVMLARASRIARRSGRARDRRMSMRLEARTAP
jgi:peptidoglycan/LPS O-acetylase OafA/YrhL